MLLSMNHDTQLVIRVKKINKSAYDALKVELYKLHKRTPTAVRKERHS